MVSSKVFFPYVVLFDKNFLFRDGSIGGLLLACQGIFCIVSGANDMSGL